MSDYTTGPEAAIEQARASLVHYGQRMAADRLAVGSAGNLSIRLGDTVVMTPTGVNYDRIADRNICVLDAEGTALDGEGARSSEWPMHRRIYDLTDAGAVVYWRARLAGSPRILSDAELDAVREAASRHRYRSGGA
jgi:L-fuculose-phosphate aldolase